MRVWDLRFRVLDLGFPGLEFVQLELWKYYNKMESKRACCPEHKGEEFRAVSFRRKNGEGKAKQMGNATETGLVQGS